MQLFRSICINQPSSMKTVTSFSLLGVLFIASTSFYSKTIVTKPTYYIIIDKSDYELTVYDADGWLVTYPCVFGNDDQGDKMQQGDRKTPEGSFTITQKRIHGKWDRMMMLDYPTKESYQKFNQRKANGQIAKTAKIGGDIGIHGTWPHEDYAIDQYQNWTQGCISLKNEHVEQLYDMMTAGSKVIIRE
jgi:murein L,D-transpeptidase YafK